MVLPQFTYNPFQVQLSFHKVIAQFEQIAIDNNGWLGTNARELLKKIAAHPELSEGITNIQQLQDDEPLIAELLAIYSLLRLPITKFKL